MQNGQIQNLSNFEGPKFDADTYQDHEGQKLNDESTECNICSKNFETSHDLQIHKKNHFRKLTVRKNCTMGFDGFLIFLCDFGKAFFQYK